MCRANSFERREIIIVTPTVANRPHNEDQSDMMELKGKII